MNIQSTINHLEANLEQQLAAKLESVAWIEGLEEALGRQDSLAFEEISERGGTLCRAGLTASSRCQTLVAELAGHWGVPRGTLTLGSVVRRLAGKGARLDLLRKELRTAVAEVMKRQRRLSALIKLHQRINTDVMQVMLGCDSKEEVNQGGALINAEA